MKENQRKQYVADQELQYALARRMVCYWSLTWIAVFALPIVVRSLTWSISFEQLARGVISDFWFPGVISVLMIPIVAWESIKYSNRFAGPIFRITRVLGDMADNRPVSPVKLRPDDFCQALATNVNRLIDASSADERTETTDANLQSAAR